MLNIVIEIDMVKYSVDMCLLCIIVITSILAIPLYGITAAENDSISKEIQWCCSYEEDRNDDIHNLLILNSLQLKHY
jgi:hypothetical protein